MSKPKAQVLSVGDTVIDAFIRMYEDRAHIYENEAGKWLAIPFGTKIPFEFAKIVNGVGNAANAAVSCARLGLKSGFVSNVGDDSNGRDIIDSLQKNGVDTHLVHINSGRKTNYHYVLWCGDERTILIKHEDYEYHWPRLKASEIPEWIYFSSLAKEGMDDFHDDLLEFLDEHQDVKMAFQPGTFQLEADLETMRPTYAKSEVVVMNREEAQSVTGGNWDDIHDLINKLHELGTRIVCVTDGPGGAYASDGDNRLKMPIYPDPAPPYDRTGAGDAFASTFIGYIIKGHDIEGALQHAPINSMSVVQKIGAQEGLLSEDEIDKYLRKAPDWYKPEPF